MLLNANHVWMKNRRCYQQYGYYASQSTYFDFFSHSVYVEYFFSLLNLLKQKGFNFIHNEQRSQDNWFQYQPLPKLIISSPFQTLALQGSQEAVMQLSRYPGHDTGYCCSPLTGRRYGSGPLQRAAGTLGRLRKEGPGWCGGDGGSGASDYGSAGSQTAEGQTAVSSQPACTLSGCAPSRGALKMALCKESAGGNKRVTWASPHLYSHQTSFFRCHLIGGWRHIIKNWYKHIIINVSVNYWTAASREFTFGGSDVGSWHAIVALSSLCAIRGGRWAATGGTRTLLWRFWGTGITGRGRRTDQLWMCAVRSGWHDWEIWRWISIYKDTHTNVNGQISD